MLSTRHPQQQENDAALLGAIAERRDQHAFAALFETYAPRIKTWVRKAGASETTADEAAQETMLAIWRKAHQFDETRAPASTWIFAIARNARIHALRKERHPSELPADVTPTVPPAEEEYLSTERQAQVEQALARLPKEQAQIIQMAYLEDKTHSQIVAELKIPLGTVKSRIRLALARLRGIVAERC